MKILVCDPVEREVIDLLREKLEVQESDDPHGTDADALIVRSRTKITREVIESAPNLKIIGRQGVGLDNIAVSVASSRGIAIVNTPEALTKSVAELTVGLMLSLARDIPKADRGMREGKWMKGQLRQLELSTKTLGILGLGNIGTSVASICRGMDMRTIYWSRHRKRQLEEKLGLVYVEFDDLFRQADFLSIHLMLTSETKGMVGSRELSLMKFTSFLINTARGAIVEEDSLYEALTNGLLAGAGIDVYQEEPYSGKLRDLSNVVLTPHVGSDTREAQLKSGLTLASKILAELGL